MPDDDVGPSLSERVRSLPLSPELQDVREVLLELTERVEQATAVEAVLARADAAPRPVGARHRRDRRGFRVIPGGLAGLAPLAASAHAPVLPVTATVARFVWRSPRAQIVATALLLGLAGAGGNGTVIDADHGYPVCSPACAEAEQDAAQAAESLTWHRMPVAPAGARETMAP